VIDFEAFAARKTREASRALHPFETVEHNGADLNLRAIGSPWTRRLYDGPFYQWPLPADVPAVSLVFVQSRDRNTGADNPDALGGGPTDKHLIYEGLSRVAVDAVLAGATTAAGEQVFFSVWHPELVALREQHGLPRHPAQVIVSGTGGFDVESSLACNVPGVRAFVIARRTGARALAHAVAHRPWVSIIEARDEDLVSAMRTLRADHEIRRISAVGGRRTATSLIDAGLVQDVCLTTAAKSGGEPNTPFYAGARPQTLRRIVAKRGTDPDYPILFEHFSVDQ
jgi:riboflavin biosynthesis pyrimidine reductase